ncbi:histone deacetylase [Kitasatospora sp. NPDC059827]|uniref:histone deacetylase n=1 Tax=Kitasatospora sp. NPDC059827 TaxID=3346964 RepID=UPI00365E2A46
MTTLSTARRPEPLTDRDSIPDLVWYAAYGSNMHLDRLMYYIAGGRPPGGTRAYPGCRDQRPPRAAVPVLLPGQLYFSLESKVWTGGMGFYDQTDDGEMPARAFLITPEQFSDIAAQEMHEPPGRDLDLAPALRLGSVRLGPGRYETLVCTGQIDGYPVLTFTAPWRRADAKVTRPSAAYLRNFASGLHEAHGWSTEETAAYLSARPGAAGAWTTEAIMEALSTGPSTIEPES